MKRAQWGREKTEGRGREGEKAGSEGTTDTDETIHHRGGMDGGSGKRSGEAGELYESFRTRDQSWEPLWSQANHTWRSKVLWCGKHFERPKTCLPSIYVQPP